MSMSCMCKVLPYCSTCLSISSTIWSTFFHRLTFSSRCDRPSWRCPRSWQRRRRMFGDHTSYTGPRCLLPTQDRSGCPEQSCLALAGLVGSSCTVLPSFSCLDSVTIKFLVSLSSLACLCLLGTSLPPSGLGTLPEKSGHLLTFPG